MGEGWNSRKHRHHRIKPSGSRRRRKRNRRHTKQKLSIRKKSGGQNITINVYNDNDLKVVDRVLDIDNINTVGELKQLLLATFHRISSITTVICLIRKRVPGPPDDPMDCSFTDQLEKKTNDTDNIPTNTHTVNLHINNGCTPSTTHCPLLKEDYTISTANSISINTQTITTKYKNLIGGGRDIQCDTEVYIASSTGHSTKNLCFRDLGENREFTFDQDHVDYADRVNVTDNIENTTFTLHFRIP